MGHLSGSCLAWFNRSINKHPSQVKITAIKQQVKKPERVSIFLDEKYSFSLSLDELVKYKLKNGDELTELEAKKYKKISDDGKLRARALEWVLNRPHSVREFNDYMYRKKAEPKLSESLVEEFTHKGYLNERKFGEWLIDLQTRRAKSNRAIRSELFKKGLDRELINELLASPSGEKERLKKLIEKKSKTSRYKEEPQKLAQYLAGQGFNWQDIKQALALNTPED